MTISPAGSRAVSPVQEIVPSQASGSASGIASQPSGQLIDPSSQWVSGPQAQSSQSAAAERFPGLPIKRRAHAAVSDDEDSRAKRHASGSPHRPRMPSPRPQPAAQVSKATPLADPAGTTSAANSPSQVGAEINAARVDIENDLEFVTLCAALEVGVPARVGAAISLIADGTVTPDDFFHEDKSVVRNLLDMYNGPRPDLSHFKEKIESPTDIDRLSSDIDTLQRLIAACRQSPHPRIRDAADESETAAVCLFIERAASLPSKLHAEAINLMVPTLDRMLQKQEPGNSQVPGMDDLLQTLDKGLTVATHPDARQTYYSYGLKFLAHQPASPEKAERAVSFAHSVGLLPAAHQGQAIKDALQMIAGIPHGDLDHQAQVDTLAHPFTECAYSLAAVSDDVFGPSAIELLRASSGITAGVSLQPELCKVVARIALLPRPSTGVVRFAGLPDADKVNLFLEMLDSSLERSMYQMGGAREWGPQMLAHLPQSVKQQAADLLRLAKDGRSPMLGFRLAAMDWQW